MRISDLCTLCSSSGVWEHGRAQSKSHWILSLNSEPNPEPSSGVTFSILGDAVAAEAGTSQQVSSTITRALTNTMVFQQRVLQRPPEGTFGTL